MRFPCQGRSHTGSAGGRQSSCPASTGKAAWRAGYTSANKRQRHQRFRFASRSHSLCASPAELLNFVPTGGREFPTPWCSQNIGAGSARARGGGGLLTPTRRYDRGCIGKWRKSRAERVPNSHRKLFFVLRIGCKPIRRCARPCVRPRHSL